MKKQLFIVTILWVLTSCSSPLDKKVSITEWKETIEIIKTQTDEYTPKDYSAAGDALARNAFGAMLEDGKPKKVTYRELLDKAKADRLQKEMDMEKWEAEVDKLRKVFDLKVVSGKYTNDGSAYYPHNYEFDVIISTTGDQSIAAVKGDVNFYNDEGDRLFRKHIEEALKIKPNTTREASISAILDTDDNLTEIKALPFEKITAHWEPSLILLEDGTRLAAPVKPYIE